MTVRASILVSSLITIAAGCPTELDPAPPPSVCADGSFFPCDCGEGVEGRRACGAAAAECVCPPTPPPEATCYERIEGPLVVTRPEPEPSEPSTMTRTATDGELELQCETVTRDATRSLEDIVAVTAAYAVPPGTVIDAESVHEGHILPSGPRRAPGTLFIDLPVAAPARVVDDPTTASLMGAVAELQREADPILGSLPDVPARLALDVEEAHSAEQALQALGISAAFSAPFASGGFGTDLGGSRSVRDKSVVVRLYQPMYTISFADDAYPRNRDFFHDDLAWTEADVCPLVARPLAYVKSVTYGRMVLYTITSQEFHSASDLAVEVRAAYDGLLASGTVTVERQERYEQLVARSRVRAVVFGGSQTDAFDAIASGDFRAFFRASRAIAAVPLSMRIQHLAEGRPLLTLRSTTRFSQECCTPTNCPPPPLTEHEHGTYTLNTGWHLGGVSRAAWGTFHGGPCTDGRTRLRVEPHRIDGAGTCHGTEWLTSEPTDCRAVLRYTRPGSSFIVCSWTIVEGAPGEHPDPLCRPGSC